MHGTCARQDEQLLGAVRGRSSSGYKPQCGQKKETMSENGKEILSVGAQKRVEAVGRALNSNYDGLCCYGNHDEGDSCGGIDGRGESTAPDILRVADAELLALADRWDELPHAICKTHAPCAHCLTRAQFAAELRALLVEKGEKP
jgi:hypothetical protein